MSNTIDNLLLSESSTTPSPIAEQPNKDKPSLFDSLLSNISSSEEVKIENISTPPSKNEFKDTEVKTNKVEISDLESSIKTAQNIDLESVEVLKTDLENDKNQKIVTTGSLLDKLVIEAKKSVEKANNIGIKESIKIDNKIENIKVNSEVVSNTQEINLTDIPTSELLSKSSENVDSKKEIDNILNLDIDDTKDIVSPIKNKEIVIDENLNKETNSLLDRLILEANKSNKEIVNNKVEKVSKITDIKELSTDEELLKVDKNITTSENIKSEVEDIKIDNKKEQVIIGKDEIVDSLGVEINSVENVLPTIIKKEDIKTVLNDVVVDKDLKDKEVIADLSLEQKTQENNSTISLFDKIISQKVDSLDTTQTLEKSIKSNSEDLKSSNEILNVEEVLVSNISNEVINDKEKPEVKPEVVSIKKDEKLSLMDQLIQKNSEKLTLETTLGNNVMDSSLKEVITKDLISNIYLGSQKNKINNQTLFNKNEAMSILKDGNSIQSVKTSAEILDLGLEDISIDESIAVDKLDLKELNKKGILENLLLRKNVKSEEIKNLITKSVEASKALLEDTITLGSDVVVNVNSPISYNIQSKIIGAKQQMATMMSDVARQMYENYKPPVTAFKINLNPTELGSIAILMKSDKNNGLSITMNVSNNVTLDTLIENQNLLKNSLNKTFDENTKFNLDFGSSNQNSNNQSSSNQNQSNRQFEQQMDTQTILQLKEENKDIEEKVIDYM